MSFAAVLQRLEKLENPFPGLRPFDTKEAHLFFGRDQQISELVCRLERNSFVAVVGVSGCGKSSVVSAGLIPALLHGRMTDSRVRWRIVVSRPAGAPFANLAGKLLQAGLDPAPLPQTSYGLIHVAQQLPSHERLLVVVDQFEEIFRHKDLQAVTEEARRQHEQAAAEAYEFVQVLLAASRYQPPVYVVITMRTDYLGDCAEFRDLPEALNECQYLIPRLTRDQRRLAIECPLGSTQISPALVQRMLNDAGDEPDQLPILQHALMRTWSRWRKSDPGRTRKIELEDYEVVGGFQNALDKHADELLSAVPRDIAATIFKRLTAQGHNLRERRDPARVAEIWELCGANTQPEQDRVNVAIDHFREQEATFLLPREGHLGPDTYIDIAHESLIRQWRILRDQWLPEESKAASTFLDLVARARNWKARRGELLAGLDLAGARGWKRRVNPTGTWARHYADESALSDALEFISESVALREREAAAQEERRNKEVENAERLREAADARAEAERLRATEQAKHAAEQKQRAEELQQALERAERSQAIARSRELVASSLLNEEVDPELSIMLAAHAVATTWRQEHLVLPEAEFQLHRAILGSRIRLTLRGHRDSVCSVAWSSDGERLATASYDQTAKVWDADTGQELLTLTGHRNIVLSVTWSPDGRRLATGSGDGTAKVWDAKSGKKLLTLTGHSNTVSSVAWSPDGKRLATGSWDETAKVWDAKSGEELLTLTGHSSSVSSVAWSPDGKRLATAGDQTARVWDAKSGKELQSLTGHSGSIGSVAWSPDGKRLATASNDQTAKVWDAKSGKQLLTLTGHSTFVDSVAWSVDGKQLATGSSDHTTKVWDAQSGEELLTLTGYSDAVQSVSWSPARPGRAKRLATGSRDKTTTVWDTGGGEELLTLTGHSSSVESVAWSPDGKRLATGGSDDPAKVWDAETGKVLLTLTGSAVLSVAWSPDGKRLATGSSDDPAKVWDAETGKALLTLTGHRGAVLSVAWSPDGKRLATGSSDDAAKVWDAETGKALLTLTGHRGAVLSMAWSPDGKRLATGSSDDVAKVWDAETGEELRTLSHHGNSVGSSVGSVAWSPDGKRLATTGRFDETAKEWDAGSGRELLTLTGHSSSVESVAWSPNGKRLATGSWDYTAKVWDATSGKELLTLTGRRRPVNCVAWSPDGKRLATASKDGTVQVYAMDIHDLMNLARERITTQPSEGACKKYLHVDKCPPFPDLPVK